MPVASSLLRLTRIEGIVRTLDRELSVPSTVKIRLVNANELQERDCATEMSETAIFVLCLRELQDTLNLVSRLEAYGLRH